MKLSSQLPFRLTTILILSISFATMSTAGVVSKAQADVAEVPQSTSATAVANPSLQFAAKIPDARFDSEHPAKFDLPALPKRAGLKPVLRLRMVVGTPATTGTRAGFNYNASVVFNGTALQRLTKSNKERLILRPPVFKLLSTGKSYDVFKGEWLAIMFAHDGDIGDSMTADGRGATFTFDLSDVARDAASNSLEILGKTAPEALKKHVGTDAGNGLGKATDVEVGYLPQDVSSSPTSAPAHHN